MPTLKLHFFAGNLLNQQSHKPGPEAGLALAQRRQNGQYSMKLPFSMKMCHFDEK